MVSVCMSSRLSVRVNVYACLDASGCDGEQLWPGVYQGTASLALVPPSPSSLGTGPTGYRRVSQSPGLLSLSDGRADAVSTGP